MNEIPKHTPPPRVFHPTTREGRLAALMWVTRDEIKLRPALKNAHLSALVASMRIDRYSEEAIQDALWEVSPE